MKKIAIYIAVVILFLASIISAYIVGKNKSYTLVNKEQVVNNEENVTKEKGTKGNRYASLEQITANLNDKTDKLHLTKNFSSYAVAYAPLYKLINDYENSTKTNDGEIISVSKYIQGTYEIDKNTSVDVVIVQDKTFENGGLVYINDNKENYVVYKYKESFLIFKYSYDISSDINTNKKTSDFIKEFFSEYNKAYVASLKTIGIWYNEDKGQ